MTWKRWTVADDEELRRRWKAMEPKPEIAAAMGRGLRAIMTRVTQLRLGYREKTGRKVSVNLDRLAHLARSGYSDRQIAKDIGRSVGSVRYHRRAQGIARFLDVQRSAPRWRQVAGHLEADIPGGTIIVRPGYGVVDGKMLPDDSGPEYHVLSVDSERMGVEAAVLVAKAGMAAYYRAALIRSRS